MSFSYELVLHILGFFIPFPVIYSSSPELCKNPAVLYQLVVLFLSGCYRFFFHNSSIFEFVHIRTIYLPEAEYLFCQGVNGSLIVVSIADTP